MLKNNLIILNPKKTILNPNLQEDKIEIDKREKNTYYNKIIKINNRCEKILEITKK
jgi:hypothetical protein